MAKANSYEQLRESKHKYTIVSPSGKYKVLITSFIAQQNAGDIVLLNSGQLTIPAYMNHNDVARDSYLDPLTFSLQEFSCNTKIAIDLMGDGMSSLIEETTTTECCCVVQ